MARVFVVFVVLIACCAAPARAIRIGLEDRMTFADYARSQGYAAPEFRTMFGAMLRITCPWGRAGGALVADRVIITVAHIMYGPRDWTNPRSRCHAESVLEPGRLLRFDTDVPPEHLNDRDALVLRLRENPLLSPPFELGPPPRKWERVIALAQGQINWPDHSASEPSVGSCTVLQVSRHGFETDCDSDRGSSGGAILSLGRLVGVTVGSGKQGTTHFAIDPVVTRAIARLNDV